MANFAFVKGLIPMEAIFFTALAARRGRVSRPKQPPLQGRCHQRRRRGVMRTNSVIARRQSRRGNPSFTTSPCSECRRDTRRRASSVIASAVGSPAAELSLSLRGGKAAVTIRPLKPPLQGCEPLRCRWQMQQRRSKCRGRRGTKAHRRRGHSPGTTNGTVSPQATEGLS